MSYVPPKLCSVCVAKLKATGFILLPKPARRVLEIFEQHSLLTGISLGRLTGPEQTREVVTARRNMLRHARDETGASTILLGRLCGNRDPSTIRYILKEK